MKLVIEVKREKNETSVLILSYNFYPKIVPCFDIQKMSTAPVQFEQCLLKTQTNPVENQISKGLLGEELTFDHLNI